MKSVKKQSFDFSLKENQQKLEEWIVAFKEIPFPLGYSVNRSEDDLIWDEADKVDAVVIISYKYLSFEDDKEIWFTLHLFLNKDGSVDLRFHGNYTLGSYRKLLSLVNKRLVQMGFRETSDLEISDQKLSTWQKGYNKMCDIFRKTQHSYPKLESKDQFKN